MSRVMATELSVSPRKTCQFLVITIIGFTLAGTAVQFIKYRFGHDYLFGLTHLFNLATDVSIPAWYSSATLLLCSLLLAIIYLAKRRNAEQFAIHWAILSLIFLYLSIDEAAQIHEIIGETLSQKVTGNTHGFIHYTWVLLGIPFVLIVAAFYLKFLLHLPRKTMRLFVLAGVVYVGGALITDMINGRQADIHGPGNLRYQMTTVAEEFLEMTGIVIFIYALLTYMSSEVRSVRIIFEQQDRSTSRLSQIKESTV
jgi:hypothetical protein